MFNNQSSIRLISFIICALQTISPVAASRDGAKCRTSEQQMARVDLVCPGLKFRLYLNNSTTSRHQDSDSQHTLASLNIVKNKKSNERPLSRKERIFVITQNMLDEYRTKFRQMLNDDHWIDQHLANFIHAIHRRGGINTNYFEFNSGDLRTDLNNEQLVVGDSHVNQRLCGEHLDKMLVMMQEMELRLKQRRRIGFTTRNDTSLRLDHRHLRLARVLEAFGRYDSGYMSGKTHSFGSYHQCVNSHLDLNDNQDDPLVRSRFCWAKLNQRAHLDDAFKAEAAKAQYLNVGICLPSTCHTSSFRFHGNKIQRLVDSQFKLPQSIYVEDHLSVESIFCTVDEDSKIGIPTSGKVLIGLLIGWLLTATAVTLLGTRPDEMSPVHRSRLGAALTCLDLRQSWMEFMGHTTTKTAAEPQQPQARRVDLNTLNPVRWAGCAFVIWGHALLVRNGFTQDQIEMANLFERAPFGSFVMVATVVVDTFFAMTGLIMSYLVMKKATRAHDTSKQPASANINEKSGAPKFLAAVFQIIKTRYIRLLPMLVIFYWFKRSVFIYLGSGPLWDFGFNRETMNGACRQESWLVPFTFTSAFKPLSKQCLMQSWSVSNDMFFVVLFAPIMLIMTRKPKLAAFLSLSLSLVSMQAFMKSIRALDPSELNPIEDLKLQGMVAMFARISHIYSFPIYRVSSFAVGCLSGYVLHHYNEAKLIKQWPRWFKGPATNISLLYIMGLFVIVSNALHIKPFVDPYHRLLFPYFMTVGKMIWALSNCVVFLRMMTDWNESFWMRGSAGKFWQCLSKINYAMLLSHFDLLIYDAVAVPQASLNNWWTIYQSFATIYTICLLLSTFVYVVIENPLDKLTRQFLFASTRGVTGASTNDGSTNDGPNQHANSKNPTN